MVMFALIPSRVYYAIIPFYWACFVVRRVRFCLWPWGVGCWPFGGVACEYDRALNNRTEGHSELGRVLTKWESLTIRS